MTTDYQALDVLDDKESLEMISSVDMSRNKLLDVSQGALARQLLASIEYFSR